MPLICDSDSRPTILDERTVPYVAGATSARLRAKGSGEEGGAAPAAAVPSSIWIDPIGSSMNDQSSSADVLTEETFPNADAVTRALFKDQPFETPTRKREVSAQEFTAGVSHHWAPLLTRAFMHPGRRLEVHMRD